MRRFTLWNALRWLAITVAAAGALATIAGGMLPWLILPLLGAKIPLPGLIAGGAGATAAAAAGLALSPRKAWLTAMLGLIPIWLAVEANRNLGREIVQRQLAIETRLNPVNEQLARVGVPPLSLFPSFGPARSYLGDGIAWTLWGGVGMVGGGAAATWTGWRRRTCRRCHVLWPTDRLNELRHCPKCGIPTADATLACAHCFGPLETRDQFCVRCGTPTPKAKIA